jgi:hypothetical protein
MTTTAPASLPDTGDVVPLAGPDTATPSAPASAAADRTAAAPDTTTRPDTRPAQADDRTPDRPDTRPQRRADTTASGHAAAGQPRVAAPAARPDTTGRTNTTVPGARAAGVEAAPAGGVDVLTTMVPVAGGVFARRVVTIAAVLAVAACFGFSFGNVLELGRFLGAPDWVAWLIDPAVAVTVAGLVVGVRYLALHGIPGPSMRPARAMLAAAGLTTLSLNIAAALFARGHGDQGLAKVADQMAISGSIWWRVGAAGYDAIAPLLLLGWAEVGPWFLRNFHMIATASEERRTPATAMPEARASTAVVAGSPTRTATRRGVGAARTPRPGQGGHRPADSAAAVQARIAAAYAAGRPGGQPWTARTLAEAAGCGKTAAATFLRTRSTSPTALTPDAQEVHA